jgi:hypothetical protein
MLHHVVLWVCVERMVANLLMGVVRQGGDVSVGDLDTFLFFLLFVILGGDGVYL